MAVIQNSPEVLTRKANALRLVISDQIALVKDVTYPFLSSMSQKVFARQKTIKWNADVGGEDVTIKDIVEDAQYAPQGVIEPADLPIGTSAITHSFDLDLSEVEQALAVAAPDELRNIFDAHVKRGLTKMMRKVNSLLFKGDGSKASCRMIGLEKVIDPAYAYAGVDADGWESPILVPQDATTSPFSGTLRDLSADLLRKMETLILRRESTYDMIVTTPEIVEKYKALFDSKRSFAVAGNAAQSNADLGIADVSYNGRPILADPHCTENAIYFLDSRELFLHTYRVKGDTTLEGMAIKIGQLATQNIYSERWELGVIPQLQVFNRKGVAALTQVK